MTSAPPFVATTLLSQVRSILPAQGQGAYLVGGFVRDILLGRPSRDLDIAVPGDSLATARRLADALGGSYYPLDTERAMGRAQIPSPEGTWTVDVSPLAGTLDQDLARRDFTIDAMAFTLADPGLEAVETPRLATVLEALHDPFGGRADLERRKICALSEGVFTADPARLLRAVRLAGELDFSLDEETAGWVRAHAGEVTRLSGERARDELAHLLDLPLALPWLRTLDDLGLLCALIPELAATRGVEQPSEHYWDVFNHNLEAVGFAERMLLPAERKGDAALGQIPWRPAFVEHFDEELAGGRRRGTAFKMAALLHDIAKPQTKTQEPSGRTRFFGHTSIGAEIAEEIMGRLRFSRRETRIVSTMVEQHLRPTQISHDWEVPTRRAVYRYFRDLEEVAIDVVYLSLADHLAAVGPRLNLEEWRRHSDLAGHILALGLDEEVASPPRLITGHDLMASMGLSPSPEVGRLLEVVREAQAAGQVRTQEEALTMAATARRDG